MAIVKGLYMPKPSPQVIKQLRQKDVDAGEWSDLDISNCFFNWSSGFIRPPYQMSIRQRLYSRVVIYEFASTMRDWTISVNGDMYRAQDAHKFEANVDISVRQGRLDDQEYGTNDDRVYAVETFKVKSVNSTNPYNIAIRNRKDGTSVVALYANDEALQDKLSDARFATLDVLCHTPPINHDTNKYSIMTTTYSTGSAEEGADLSRLGSLVKHDLYSYRAIMHGTLDIPELKSWKPGDKKLNRYTRSEHDALATVYGNFYSEPPANKTVSLSGLTSFDEIHEKLHTRYIGNSRALELPVGKPVLEGPFTEEMELDGRKFYNSPVVDGATRLPDVYVNQVGFMNRVAIQRVFTERLVIDVLDYYFIDEYDGAVHSLPEGNIDVTTNRSENRTYYVYLNPEFAPLTPDLEGVALTPKKTYNLEVRAKLRNPGDNTIFNINRITELAFARTVYAEDYSRRLLERHMAYCTDYVRVVGYDDGVKGDDVFVSNVDDNGDVYYKVVADMIPSIPPKFEDTDDFPTLPDPKTLPTVSSNPDDGHIPKAKCYVLTNAGEVATYSLEHVALRSSSYDSSVLGFMICLTQFHDGDTPRVWNIDDNPSNSAVIKKDMTKGVIESVADNGKVKVLVRQKLGHVLQPEREAKTIIEVTPLTSEVHGYKFNVLPMETFASTTQYHPYVVERVLDSLEVKMEHNPVLYASDSTNPYKPGVLKVVKHSSDDGRKMSDFNANFHISLS